MQQNKCYNDPGETQADEVEGGQEVAGTEEESNEGEKQPFKKQKEQVCCLLFLKKSFIKKYAKRTFIIRSLAVRKIW